MSKSHFTETQIAAMPETGLTFETTIAAGEVREAVGPAYWRFFIILAVIAFGLLTLFRLQRPWRDSWDLITDLLSYAIGFAIGFVIFGFGLLFLSSNRLARRSEENGPAKYLVTEDGIDIVEENVEAKLRWHAFAGFIEKRSLILLRVRRTRKLLIIPKRCLSKSVENSLLATLSSKLAKLSA